MKKIEGYDLVNEAGETKSLPAGAYPLVIKSVTDYPDSEYLDVEFDIVSGEYKGYFSILESNTGKKMGTRRSYYSTKALPFFKQLIGAVEKTNKGYVWNWDEKTLVGKYVVGVFGEEEYLKDGEVKVSVKLDSYRSAEALKEGKIKIPERKKLPEDQLPKTESNTVKLEMLDSDLPF